MPHRPFDLDGEPPTMQQFVSACATHGDLPLVQATAQALIAKAKDEQVTDWWRQLNGAVQAMKDASETLQNLADNLVGEGLVGREAISHFWDLGFPQDFMMDGMGGGLRQPLQST